VSRVPGYDRAVWHANTPEISLLVGLSILYTSLRFRPLPRPTSLTLRPSSPGASIAHVNGAPSSLLRERTPKAPASHSNSALHLPSTGSMTKEKIAAAAVEEVGEVGIGGRGCVWGTEEREYR